MGKAIKYAEQVAVYGAKGACQLGTTLLRKPADITDIRSDMRLTFQLCPFVPPRQDGCEIRRDTNTAYGRTVVLLFLYLISSRMVAASS